MKHISDAQEGIKTAEKVVSPHAILGNPVSLSFLNRVLNGRS
jgi:hypothetical protein